MVAAIAVATPALSAASITPGSLPAGHEVVPTSRLVMQTIWTLRNAGYDELKYRAAFSGLLRTDFSVGGADYKLYSTSASSELQRAALSSSGPIALLLKVNTSNQTLNRPASYPAPLPVYALFTLQKTKLVLWAFFDQVPDDLFLSTSVRNVIEGGRHALARFDPLVVGKVGLGSPALISSSAAK